MNVNEGDVLADFTLAAGDTADFILSYVDKISPNVEDIKSFVDRTLMEEINYWKNWIEQSNYQGRWRETVNRSALILKLMTSYEYGSLVAAPTFGLPEEIGGELGLPLYLDKGCFFYRVLLVKFRVYRRSR